jgi:phage shock protein PspC (stress-responsive transcriptional regulator)
MCGSTGAEQDQYMTETPQHEREGVLTQNLRDYTNLRRARTDRKVAGVAGGLGRHLNIDPTILRVLFVVLCFFGGAGFILYGAAWLLVPEEGSDRAVISTSPSTRTALLLGAAVVAAFLLIGDSWGGFHFPWPLAIVALVVFVILMNRDKPMSEQPPRPPADPGGPLPSSASTPGTPTGTETLEGTGYTPEDTTVYGTEPPVPPWTPPVAAGYVPPQPRPDRGPRLFGITLALVAVALGSLGLYDVSGGHVVASAYPALALAVTGLMLVVGAWVGRAGGLVFLGLVAALALAVSSVAHGPFGNFGDSERLAVRPASAAAVHDGYSIPTGRIHLDLRNVHDPAALDGRTIDVHANVGELVVILPPGVGATIDANVSGPGDITLPGRDSGGINTHLTQDVTSGNDVSDLHLNLDLAVGHIEVRQ